MQDQSPPSFDARALNENSSGPRRHQLVILGMHRSGTSAFMNALAASGAFVGEPDELLPPAADNPRGFFERKDALAIHRELIQGAGGDWWQLVGLDVGTIAKDTLENCRRRFGDLIARLDRAGLWALKDPRLCFVLPTLTDLLDAPVAIIVYRNPLQVAKSLQRRNSMAISEGLALWDAYNRAALQSSQPMARVLVCYEDLCNDPAATIQDTVNQLRSLGVQGLTPPDASTLREIVSTTFGHSATEESETESYLVPSQRELFRALCDRSALDGKTATAPDAIVLQHLRDLEFRHAALVRQTRAADDMRAKLTKSRQETREHADHAASLQFKKHTFTNKINQLNDLLEKAHDDNTELARRLDVTKTNLEERDQQPQELRVQPDRVTSDAENELDPDFGTGA